MSDIFDADPWPRWLVDVAVRVDELVAEPSVMEYFRRMLRDWKAEHDKRGPKFPTDKRGYIRYNSTEFWPRRRMTLPEKYARLAAIHDVICEKAKRIDPWGTHKSFQSRGGEKTKAGTAYAVLYQQVKELEDSDRERVEGVLRDVENDLALSVKAVEEKKVENVSHSGVTPKQSGAGDSQDTTKDQRKAEKSTIPPRARTASVWNELTNRQRNSLEALSELKAFDADSRQTTDTIAIKAEGRSANVNGFKAPLSELAKRGLLESKTGREGGYWLSTDGRALVEAAEGRANADERNT